MQRFKAFTHWLSNKPNDMKIQQKNYNCNMLKQTDQKSEKDTEGLGSTPSYRVEMEKKSFSTSQKS